jgi:ABC-2 type transport system ATP-binding protein
MFCMVPAIHVEHLSKSYGKISALNSISFDVKPQEIFALVGPNGAGKSTALRIIATILSPTSGTVEVFGTSIAADAQAIRSQISYLPEEAGAYKNMSGIGYLSFMASLYTGNSMMHKEFVEEATEICDLGPRLKDKVKTYSKGMTRKLLLARALMSRPKIAILDEPTSGLDVTNALFIRDTIKSYVKKGMTVLLSSHNMLEIEYLSDRIALIHEGAIVETGTAPALMKEHNAHNLEEVFRKVTRS